MTAITKPSEFIAKHIQAADADLAREVAQITEYVEQRLVTGQLVIGSTRSGWSNAAIAEVARRYRAAGWVVQEGGDRSAMYTFSLPSDLPR